MMTGFTAIDGLASTAIGAPLGACVPGGMQSPRMA